MMTGAKAVGTALAGVLALCVLVPAVAAAEGQDLALRVYRGETSQGQRMRIVTYTDRTGTWVKTLRLGRAVTLGCEDGSETEGWWFDRGLEREIPVAEGRFAYDNLSWWQATHVHGRLGPRDGSGTLLDAQAVLVAGEQAQLCTSDELTWDVERVVEAARTPALATRARLVTGAKAGAGSSDPRDYEGRTSQGGKMSISVGTAGGFLSLGYPRTLGCDDGSELRWTWGMTFFGVATSGARLDLDLVSPRDALHVHGRLGVREGAGTLTETAPALTADERAAQICTTGELTWRVWRIDEGF